MSIEKYYGGRIYYVWTVDDPDIGMNLNSTFIKLDGNDFRFSIAAYSNFENEKEWWLSIFHRCTNNWRWKMTIFVKVRSGELAFLTCAGTVLVEHQIWLPLWSGTVLSHEHIVNRKITFVFTFDEFLENITDIILGEKQIETACLQELSYDMEQMRETCDSADRMLKCRDELFPVNLSLLKIRSEAFFRSLPETEPFDHFVTVSDMEPLILEMLLGFLYSGTVDLWTENVAVKLYCVASRYRIRGLQQKCGHFFVKRLSVRNICEFFELAFNYQDTVLLQSIVIFAARHENFLLSDEWSRFASQKTEIAVTLFNDILSVS